MMERSSRFISLSGLSGISAGICALIGAWLAYPYTTGRKSVWMHPDEAGLRGGFDFLVNTWLFWIAIGTLLAALLTAFLFTWRKSKREGIPIWGKMAKRLVVGVSVPMLVGAVFIFYLLLHYEAVDMVTPACLVFYGLGLINAGKYTFGEIQGLGYCQCILGILNLCYVDYGIYFWAMGFGILHIAYGSYMWYKYGR